MADGGPDISGARYRLIRLAAEDAAIARQAYGDTALSAARSGPVNDILTADRDMVEFFALPPDATPEYAADPLDATLAELHQNVGLSPALVQSAVAFTRAKFGVPLSVHVGRSFGDLYIEVQYGDGGREGTVKVVPAQRQVQHFVERGGPP